MRHPWNTTSSRCSYTMAPLPMYRYVIPCCSRRAIYKAMIFFIVMITFSLFLETYQHIWSQRNVLDVEPNEKDRWTTSMLHTAQITNATITTPTTASTTTNNNKFANFTIPSRRNTSPKLINPNQFYYLILEEDICKNEMTEIVIYVHSAPAHIANRMCIRETWASQLVLRQIKGRLVFFLGATKDARLNEQIKNESDMYHDIIQESYIDAYRNMTYKAISAAKWIVKYCMNVRYIVKTDDDVFLNIRSTIDYLSYITVQNIDVKMCFICNLWVKRPYRSKTSKWYVTKEEYSPDVYPPFCQGGFYVYTPYAAKRLYESSFGLPFFWLDDVLYTGILAQKAGMWFKDIHSGIENKTNFRQLEVSVVKSYQLWRELNAKNSGKY